MLTWGLVIFTAFVSFAVGASMAVAVFLFFMGAGGDGEPDASDLSVRTCRTCGLTYPDWRAASVEKCHACRWVLRRYEVVDLTRAEVRV